MNKYQEALIYFCNGCHHEQEGDYGACKRVEGRCKHYRSLKELVDKEKSPTIEEVKKEWEDLGYIFYIKKPTTQWETLISIFYKDDSNDGIFIYNNQTYIRDTYSFTMQEHNLLTKTFKALGWL